MIAINIDNQFFIIFKYNKLIINSIFINHNNSEIEYNDKYIYLLKNNINIKNIINKF